MKETHYLAVETSNITEDWADFLNQNRLTKLNKHPQTIEFDMLNVRFIKPHHVVSLACLIEEYHLKKIEISFKNTSSKGAKYLEKLNFFQYWEEGFNRKDYRQTQIGTAFCLWKLHPEMISPYTSMSTNYYRNHFFSGKDLQPLDTALVEIFNNIIDHAQSEVSGYVFTQYYPNKNEIVLSMCDFGKGIPNTINTFLKQEGKEPLTDDEALEKAFEKGFSTKSTPQNRGFGLNNVISAVKTLKSGLTITSNHGFVEQNSTYFRKRAIANNFPGTQIVIKLKTENLRPLETEEISEQEFYL
ncbi:MAG: ATP-binding protein [Bacteroidia bacterium]